MSEHLIELRCQRQGDRIHVPGFASASLPFCFHLLHNNISYCWEWELGRRWGWGGIYTEVIVTSGLRVIVILFLSIGKSKLATNLYRVIVNFSKVIVKV